MALTYPAGYDDPVASLAMNVMQAIVNTYSAAAVALPSRQVITIGTVAVDEEILALMFGGVTIGPPGNELREPLVGDSPRSAVFNVELWRNTPAIGPSGNAPSAVTVTDSSKILMKDAWLLLEAANAADQMGIGVIARTTVNASEGGLIGVSMIVELTVP